MYLFLYTQLGQPAVSCPSASVHVRDGEEGIESSILNSAEKMGIKGRPQVVKVRDEKITDDNKCAVICWGKCMEINTFIIMHKPWYKTKVGAYSNLSFM